MHPNEEVVRRPMMHNSNDQDRVSCITKDNFFSDELVRPPCRMPSCCTRSSSHRRRSQDCIFPMKGVTESLENDCGSDGFTVTLGNVPTACSPQRTSSDVDDDDNDDDDDDDWISCWNPSIDNTLPDAAHPTLKRKRGIKHLFRKSWLDYGRIFNSDECEENHYRKKQDQPEWDGTEDPVIVSGMHDRVSVIEADKSEKPYGFVTEQFSPKTKKAGQKNWTFKMLCMPKRNSHG